MLQRSRKISKALVISQNWGGDSNLELARQSTLERPRSQRKVMQTSKTYWFPKDIYWMLKLSRLRLTFHAESPRQAESGFWQSYNADQIKIGIWDLPPEESILGCQLKTLEGYTLKWRGNQKDWAFLRPSLSQFTPVLD